ncbi:amidase [Leifsonia sp. AK011]|uniref:amidase n=1 Tax=Leifsonia sp. AK011 TaxID=2723075 RepID=UPI0015C9E420|nr:amidase [Leifsonia sp. AK011]
MLELHHLSAVEQLDLLRRGDLTPVELTEHYLERIDRIDGDLGAFVTVTADAALDRAHRVQADSPHAAALWGMPLGLKDLWATAGTRTTYGSRAFEHVVPDISDEIVTALEDAGSVSLGKTATPEFGLSSYTESLVSAPTRTPWDLSLGAGGSSGGAAVAVSAGLLPFAPASDGGGSIRIPAAATGLVGLKPSRGRVPSGSGFTSLAGLVAYGAIGRSVGDVGLLLDAIAGPSPWSVGPPTWDEGPWLGAAVRGEGRYQVGVMTSSPWDASHDIRISQEATDALAVATTELAAIGHGLDDFALDPEPYGEHFKVIWQASAAGIPVEGDRLELLEPLTRWLVEQGRALGARRLAEALAWLAGYERRVIRQFAPFDAVLTPALAMTPRPVGWYSEDGERNFDQQVEYTPWTSFVNVAGLPAIVLPVHQTAKGLPMGVQLIGRPGGEDVLLSLGVQLERRLRWQRRHPPQW